MSEDRRRYRRLQANVFCRPAGMVLFAKREPIDMSAGGVRIFSDQRFVVGDRLKLDIFAPDQPTMTFAAEVVWIKPLGAGAPAEFDVGLKFTQLDQTALRKLSELLGPPEPEETEPEGSGGA